MAWMRTDDLDGSPAEVTTFGLFGKAYVLDAGDATREAIKKALQPYLTVAVEYGELPAVNSSPAVTSIKEIPVSEPVPAPVKSPAARTSTPVRERTKRRAKAAEAEGKVPHSTIRSWAIANGYQVGPKGRIPYQVVEAFNAAQQTAA